MFKKILIANRGEIACRVMRTARAMGINTVAVYSEADADAVHVEMADEAVAIGPPPSAQSYLVIDRILDAIKRTGAEAVHPGYGFLSENQAFATALDEAGVAFIGPGVKAIAAMGDKIESKKLAQEAGVSTVPGHMDLIEDAEEAAHIAEKIGYPVMIKASAGGGGKGMRVAWNDQEAREGFRSARSEAKSSFADDRVFIEKFIQEPRHIEIQVLADSHGTCIHLGERECSIQRRHQKVIEEAPSPFLDEKTRAAMGAQAVALAKAVDYRSAGTVEFIVDKDRNFYFLEMNTRLQVEHPVTELVTGIDLVEQMIRVAAGETLTLTQDDVTFDGWAIEARVYAEDPVRGFLPSIGRLSRYQEPTHIPGVRCDSGVEEGSEISMFYDPMIAKLCAHGGDRGEATDRLFEALDAYYIRGVEHNAAFLSAVLDTPRFREGRLTTNFIAEEFPDGFAGREPNAAVLERLCLVAAVIQYICADRETRISGQIEGHEAHVDADWLVRLGPPDAVTARQVSVSHDEDDLFTVRLDDRSVAVRTSWAPGDPLIWATLDGEEICVQADRRGVGFQLFHGGVSCPAAAYPARMASYLAHMPVKQPPDMSRYLLAPMPGLLLSVSVAPGDPVKAGQELAVIEAMKMENTLRAERDGTVAAVHAKGGDSLAVDEKILEFE